MYRKAIELDPGYALAHARLSYLETSKFYWFQVDASDARLLDARLEAERAMTLDPDLAESHVAAGYVDYVQRDFRKAVKEFERAIQLDGNNVTVLTTLGYAERRLGAFEEYLRHERKAVELDPRSAEWPEDIAYTLTMLRRYQEAERLFDGVLVRTPDSEIALINKSRLMLLWKGDDRLAKEILAQLPARIDPSGNLTLNKHLLDLMKLYPQQASAALVPTSIVFFTARTAAFPRAFIEALAAAVDGDSALAAAHYDVARLQLEAKVKEHPDDWRFRTALGRVYAGLGRKTDAIREGVKAAELLPVSKDAVDGPSVLEELAAVHAQVGEPERAIEIVESLLSIPGFLSAPLLRIDPKWAPLRQNPRFRKLAGL